MLVSMTATMGQDITGEWNGTLSVQNTSLRLVFHINKTADGYSATMDSSIKSQGFENEPCYV